LLLGCGYWPGGSDEGSFYACAYPEPDGLGVEPDAAYHDGQLGEYVLPYKAVRTAENADATLLTFLHTTYEAAAVPGRWDRAALETGADP
jgi:hypothetical protein